MNDLADIARRVRRHSEREGRKDVASMAYALERLVESGEGWRDMPDDQAVRLRETCTRILEEYQGETREVANALTERLDAIDAIAAKREQERQRAERRKGQFYVAP